MSVRIKVYVQKPMSRNIYAIFLATDQKDSVKHLNIEKLIMPKNHFFKKICECNTSFNQQIQHNPFYDDVRTIFRHIVKFIHYKALS